MKTPAKRGRKPKLRPGTLVAYIRVSTDEQANGPEAQRQAISAYAARTTATVVAWCEDIGISGAAEMDDRPGLMAALDACREHRASAIIVAKRDRLARSVFAAILVERLAGEVGARVLSADGVSDADTPEAEMLRGMLDLFAQYERACIRMRTRAALAAKRARGERTGGIPYGMRLAPCGVRLEADPAEMATVDAIVAWRAVGTPHRAIVARLNETGVPARGNRWHLATVQRVLSKYAK